MNKYTVGVEKDNHKTNTPCWMVVIKIDKTIVGIPVRGVSEADAINMANPIRYAFEYGVNQGFKIVQDAQRFTCEAK
jgi:hypothetical protein